MLLSIRNKKEYNQAAGPVSGGRCLGCCRRHCHGFVLFGRWKECIKVKVQVWYSLKNENIFSLNQTHAGVGVSSSMFMSQEDTSSRILYANTNNLWFNCFMIGIHWRMGDIWIPDKSTSHYVFRESLKTCKDMLTAEEGDDYGRMRATRAACVVILEYFAALRGGEIGKNRFIRNG